MKITRSVKINAPKIGRGFEMTVVAEDILDLIDGRNEDKRDTLALNDYVVKMQAVGRKALENGKTVEQALVMCGRYRYGAKVTIQVVTVSRKEAEDLAFTAAQLEYMEKAGVSII